MDGIIEPGCFHKGAFLATMKASQNHLVSRELSVSRKQTLKYSPSVVLTVDFLLMCLFLTEYNKHSERNLACATSESCGYGI